MKKPRYSIWSGPAAFVWALGSICIVLAECIVLYVKISRSHFGWWSMSVLFVPIMMSLPFSTGINFFRKFTRLRGIEGDRATIDTCSLYVACIVLVANAALLICVADNFLVKYQGLLR